MKKFFALLMTLVMLISVVPFAMAAETADHEHYDENKNDVCDAPGCTEPVHSNHYDKNGNGVCDHAGCTEKVEAETTEPEAHTHVDANVNGVCDYPGCTEKMPVDPIGPGADDDNDDDDDKKDWHTHTYYGSYKRNSTKHWRQCWCGYVKPGSSESHTFRNGECRVCGYEKYGYDYDYGYGDYRVYVSDSGKGDTDVSATYADSGDIVYIYVDPDNGYKVRSIEVTTKNGRDVNLSKRSSSTYYFRMPSSNVYVEVSYTKGNNYDYNFPYGGCDEYDYYYGNYSDVSSSDWFYSAVNYVTNHEIVSGYSYNKFAPNDNFTRATLAVALYNISGANASGRESFSDVDSNDWYYDAVVWCSNKNIVKGYNGKFNPDGDITREDLAVMLYRYAEYKRYNVKDAEDLDQFSDAEKVSTYAVEAMEWAVAEGILNGMGDGTLNPQGTTTRAQAAAMLMRFCKGVR